MSSWRSAGLNYVNFSTIASKTLRRCLKQPFKDEAMKRDVTNVRCFFWVDGQMLPAGQKPEKKEKAAITA